MNGLIVAGLASLAGIAGVVGFTKATVDDAGSTEAAPALVNTVSTETPAALEERLARLKEAEKAAADALRRADAQAVRQAAAARAVPVAAPVVATYPGDDDAYDDDHYGDDDDHSRRRRPLRRGR